MGQLGGSTYIIVSIPAEKRKSMLRLVTGYGKMLLMVTCDYCDTKLKRHAFCNSAHKMQYHRTHVTESNIQNTKDRVHVTKGNNVATSVKEVKKQIKKVASRSTLCPHYQMRGVCKKGCK